MKVCHLITNPYSNDTRVIKECEALVSLGYEVDCVGVLRDGYSKNEKKGGVRITRVSQNLFDFSYLSGRLSQGVLSRLARLRNFACVELGRFLPVFFLRKNRLDTFVPEEIAIWRETEIRFPPGNSRFFNLGAFFLVLFSPLLLFTALLFVVCKKILKMIANEIFKFLEAPLWRNLHLFLAATQTRADIYQANDFDTLAIAWACAKLNNARLVYDSHELYDESFPVRKPFWKRHVIRSVEGRLCRDADSVLTVCGSIARILQERYGLAAKPSVVRNTQEFASELVQEDYLERYAGPKGTRKFLVYAGRLTRGRGLERAAAALPYCASDIVMIFMGNCDSAFKNEMDNLSRGPEVNGRLFILPPVPSETLPGVLSAADAGLMLTEDKCLSYYYGLGNKLFHYMNAGLAVLVSDQPEKRRIIDLYKNGLAVGRKEPEALGRAISDLCADADALAQMKKNSRIGAYELRWESEARSYTNIYTGLYEKILFEENIYSSGAPFLAKLMRTFDGLFYTVLTIFVTR